MKVGPRTQQKQCGSGLDVAGMLASMLCAVHCLLLPALLPVLMAVFDNPLIEIAIIGAAIVTGIAALRQGLRHHRRVYPLVVWCVGILLLVTLHIPEMFSGGPAASRHSSLTTTNQVGIAIGGLLIVVAHVANLLLHRKAHASAGTNRA